MYSTYNHTAIIIIMPLLSIGYDSRYSEPVCVFYVESIGIGTMGVPGAGAPPPMSSDIQLHNLWLMYTSHKPLPVDIYRAPPPLLLNYLPMLMESLVSSS